MELGGITASPPITSKLLPCEHSAVNNIVVAQLFASPIRPGQKWLPTVLEREISCSQ